MVVESDLHDDGPDVNSKVEQHDHEQSNLGPSPLAQALHVKNKTECEAPDDAEER